MTNDVLALNRLSELIANMEKRPHTNQIKQQHLTNYMHMVVVVCI